VNRLEVDHSLFAYESVREPVVASAAFMTILHNNFSSPTMFGGFVEVGIPGSAGYSMQFQTADSITAYLPAGGKPKPLDPASGGEGTLPPPF